MALLCAPSRAHREHHVCEWKLNVFCWWSLAVFHPFYPTALVQILTVKFSRFAKGPPGSHFFSFSVKLIQKASPLAFRGPPLAVPADLLPSRMHWLAGGSLVMGCISFSIAWNCFQDIKLYCVISTSTINPFGLDYTIMVLGRGDF